MGRPLPYAIMGMLVVYCLKDVRFTDPSEFLPALIGCLIVGALYVRKRNTLLSILGGTVGYMILVQLVF
ncbi:MAG: AzlD domain-containing protein [Oscillospiraceae bacterium]|nr:AzlD domain-containing protein [Oscillospiraceae bacterium]